MQKMKAAKWDRTWPTDGRSFGEQVVAGDNVEAVVEKLAHMALLVGAAATALPEGSQERRRLEEVARELASPARYEI